MAPMYRQPQETDLLAWFLDRSGAQVALDVLSGPGDTPTDDAVRLWIDEQLRERMPDWDARLERARLAYAEGDPELASLLGSDIRDLVVPASGVSG